MINSDTNGFNVMSQKADDVGDASGEHEDAKAFDAGLPDGLDAEPMIETAKERADEFERMLMDEVRDRPLRALAWAAAAGFVVGIWATR